MFTPGDRLAESQMDGPLTGREEVRGFFERLYQQVGHNEAEITDLEVHGDVVVASVYLHGTLRTIGISGAVPAVHVFTIRDGLIVANRLFREGEGR